MCAPDLSFLINRAKQILHLPGRQSHSALVEHFKVKEDDWVKVSYDWTTKTINIVDENSEYFPFQLKAGHYKAIHEFIDSQVGTKEKLIKWLAVNKSQEKVAEKAPEILDTQAKEQYLAERRKRPLIDFDLLGRLFAKSPNQYWAINWPYPEGNKNAA